MPSISREQFVQQVIDVAKDRFPAAKVARGDQPFSMRINGQLAVLENVYRLVSLQPDKGREMISQWILEIVRTSEGIPEHHAGFEELAERIFPVLLREQTGEGSGTATVATVPLVSGLNVGFAVDSDRSFWYVSRTTLAQWNIDIEQLHERALQNLIDRSQTIAAHAVQDEDGDVSLIVFQSGDGFDASRLLLPTLHDKLREHLGSPFVAGVPNRDILLCFRNDEENVEKLRQQIKHDFRQMPHPISDRPLLVTADGIAPLG